MPCYFYGPSTWQLNEVRSEFEAIQYIVQWHHFPNRPINPRIEMTLYREMVDEITKESKRTSKEEAIESGKCRPTDTGQ